MDNDQVCPRCKTTKYRNPSMVLMVNNCGHALCESCVDLLFVKGSALCPEPECKTTLRKNNFRAQLFEDPLVDKEVYIRKKILKEYNKRAEDFSTLREYNDYLEEIEHIVFNLVQGRDTIATNKQIDVYKRDNKDITLKNRSRQSQEEIEIEELIEIEKAKTKEKNSFHINADLEEKKQKHKAREKLIDELMFSDADASSIVASHAQSVAAAVKELPKVSAPAKANYTQFSSGIQIGNRGAQKYLPIPKQEDLPLYHYVPWVYDYNGPAPPAIENLAKSNYFVNIRSATGVERAGGYTEALACCRTLQEAMAGLFYNPQWKSLATKAAEDMDVA